MNQHEKQALVNEFQDWLRSSFLPDQEKRKGMKMSQGEWEYHFNRLSMMFASFVFFHPLLNRVASGSTKTILSAFKDHLHTNVEQWWQEDGVRPSLEEQRKEEKYFSYPVSHFLSVTSSQSN